ncbi:zinc carboxypeptidase A 1 [Aplysia californica]|uniref:Zinc carboxypeptidase A 1 n=1 Tax=Aplysia californica TaxID=6500 RepID=A0ABM1AF09_APLCA|nr:zinc carboxypeptidase A 1 [Aplysia californica]
MLNTYNWYLVPVANPDGYEYSIHSSRMWRKNRSAHPTSYFCVGIDLNRNFDSKFRQVGVSSNCHSDIYPGITAFSEAETQNLRDLVVDRKDKVVAYLGVHAYSQFLMVSWGNVLGNSRPHNYVEIDRVGKKMQSALEGHGFRYEYGTVYQLLDYAASGASMDWVLEAKPNMYSYAYELRPDQRSNDGFNLPPRYIVSQGEEYFDSLAVMAKEMSVCRAGSGYEQCQSHAVVG